MINKNVFNNKGFTLLESLIGLFVMGVIAFLILQVTMVMGHNYDDFYQERQLILFPMQIEEDFLMADKVETSNHLLTITTHDQQVISYEFQNNKILRQVENKGGEVVLADVETCKFYQQENNIFVEVSFLGEDKKYKLFLGDKKF